MWEIVRGESYKLNIKHLDVFLLLPFSNTNCCSIVCRCYFEQYYFYYDKGVGVGDEAATPLAASLTWILR